MSRRLINSAMWENKRFGKMPMLHRLLQIGMINIADDQGRVTAEPALLRARLFPYDDVSLKDIEDGLHAMVQNETITVYEAAGDAYAQMLNWWEYQALSWAQPSEMPAPEGWQDRIRYKAVDVNGKILSYNWQLRSGAMLPDTCDAFGVPTEEVQDKVSAEREAEKSSPPAPEAEEEDADTSFNSGDQDNGEHSNGTDDNTDTPTPQDTPENIGINTPMDTPERTNSNSNNKHNNSSSSSSAGAREEPPESDGPEVPTIGDIFKLYQNNIGSYGPLQADFIKDAFDEYGALDMEFAINRAVTANARHWNYIRGTLEKRRNGSDSKPATGDKANHGTNGRNPQRGQRGTIPVAAVEQFYPEPDEDAYDIPEEVLARVHALHAGHSG